MPKVSVVYAPCSNKEFSPATFDVKFCDKQTLQGWLEDDKNLRFVIRLTGCTGFVGAVYVDSATCRRVGLPDDGTTLDDVITNLHKRWMEVRYHGIH